MPMPLNQLLPQANSSSLIRELTLDSRKVRPGDLFLAVPGTQQDGRVHIADAIARGDDTERERATLDEELSDQGSQRRDETTTPETDPDPVGDVSDGDVVDLRGQDDAADEQDAADRQHPVVPEPVGQRA